MPNRLANLPPGSKAARRLPDRPPGRPPNRPPDRPPDRPPGRPPGGARKANQFKPVRNGHASIARPHPTAGFLRSIGPSLRDPPPQFGPAGLRVRRAATVAPPRSDRPQQIPDAWTWRHAKTRAHRALRGETPAPASIATGHATNPRPRHRRRTATCDRPTHPPAYRPTTAAAPRRRPRASPAARRATPAGDRVPPATASAARRTPERLRSATPPSATGDPPARRAPPVAPKRRHPCLPAPPPPARPIGPSKQRSGTGSGAARMRVSSCHTRSADSDTSRGTPPRNAANVAASGSTAAVAGEEPEEPQDPQVILGDTRSPDRRRSATARRADPPRRRSNRTPRRRGVIDIALMVKSRRAASSRQSSVNATTACRPSVSTSRRSVVISTGRSASTAVTVPCARPVGTTLIPAAVSRCITVSGGNGEARSMSTGVRFASVSRTAPPTTRASGSTSSRATKPGLRQKRRRSDPAAPAPRSFLGAAGCRCRLGPADRGRAIGTTCAGTIRPFSQLRRHVAGTRAVRLPRTTSPNSSPAIATTVAVTAITSTLGGPAVGASSRHATNTTNGSASRAISAKRTATFRPDGA